MQNNDEKRIQALIYDNTNVTQSNPIKDLIEILIQVCLSVVVIYLFIFFLSGIILKILPLEKQIELENHISSEYKVKTLPISNEEQNRLNKIKELILETDKKFPKTSNLEINLIDNEKEPNAICYPNGNIYITSALYKKLKSDEELTFVIAHEMAHYKNKDHLLKLRQNIASSTVIILMCVLSPESQNASKIISTSMTMSDLKYSREIEAKADKYAGKILINLYGTTNGGIEVLKTLSKNKSYMGEVLSSHPKMQKRINYLESLNK